jgi:uncharacterized membrane protein
MDLIAIVLLTLLLPVLTYVAPVAPARIAIGLLLVSFFTGYALVAALFPRRERLNGVERVALGLGLSLGLAPFLGLALHFSPWGLHPVPMMRIMGLWTMALAAVAWWRRHRVPPEERFELSWGSLAGWLPVTRRPRDLAVTAFLLLLVLAGVGLVAWRFQQPTTGQPFTEFYLLGRQGLLEDYPTTLRVGQPQNYNVGVVNQERRAVAYTVRAFLSGKEVGYTEQLILHHGEKWEGSIWITPRADGRQQKLELGLYRGSEREVYQRLHLFTDVAENPR